MQQRRTHELLYYAELTLRESQAQGSVEPELPPLVRVRALEAAAAALIDAALHSALIEHAATGTVVADWRSYLQAHGDDTAELRRLAQVLLPGGELSLLFESPPYAPQPQQRGYAAAGATIVSDAQQLSLTSCLQRLRILLSELRESSVEW